MGNVWTPKLRLYVPSDFCLPTLNTELFPKRDSCFNVVTCQRTTFFITPIRPISVHRVSPSFQLCILRCSTGACLGGSLLAWLPPTSICTPCIYVVRWPAWWHFSHRLSPGICSSCSSLFLKHLTIQVQGELLMTTDPTLGYCIVGLLYVCRIYIVGCIHSIRMH